MRPLSLAQAAGALLLLVIVGHHPCSSFSVLGRWQPAPRSSSTFGWDRLGRRIPPSVALASSRETAASTEPPATETTSGKLKRLLLDGNCDDDADVKVIELVLEPHKHRPLGCTVEESLAPVVAAVDAAEDDDADGGTSNGEEMAAPPPPGLHHVFVSQVRPGGNAERAGLMPGDVVVGVSDVFGNLAEVVGEGVEKVYVRGAGRQSCFRIGVDFCVLFVLRSTSRPAFWLADDSCSRD